MRMMMMMMVMMTMIFDDDDDYDDDDDVDEDRVGIYATIFRLAARAGGRDGRVIKTPS